MAKVIIGVDPHKLPATIEVVDRHEKLLGSGRFRTDQAGCTAMRTYVKNWPDRVWRSRAATAPAGRWPNVSSRPASMSWTCRPSSPPRVRLFDTGHNRKTDARDAHSIAIVPVRTTTLRVLRPRQ